MIAEYKTMLPDKKMLQAKLHEFYQILAPHENRAGKEKVRITSRLIFCQLRGNLTPLTLFC
jgi:hypothetical protein